MYHFYCSKPQLLMNLKNKLWLQQEAVVLGNLLPSGLLHSWYVPKKGSEIGKDLSSPFQLCWNDLPEKRQEYLKYFPILPLQFWARNVQLKTQIYILSMILEELLKCKWKHFSLVEGSSVLWLQKSNFWHYPKWLDMLFNGHYLLNSQTKSKYQSWFRKKL